MKNYITNIRQYSYLALISIGLISCDTSYFDQEINDPEFEISVKGLPIGYFNYTASELFENLGDDIETGTINENGKDLVSFNYTQALDGTGNSDFVEIEDQSLTGTFDLLASSGITAGGPQTYSSGDIAGDETSATFNEIKQITKTGGALDVNLTTAYFSSGTLNITLSTDTSAETTIVFNIPSIKAKIGDAPFSHTFILNNQSGGSDITTTTIDLADYNFDLTIDNFDPITNNGVNNIAVNLDATVTLRNGNIINTTDTLDYTITVANPEIESTEGDFLQKAFSIEDQNFGLSFFEAIENGSLSLNSATFKISATNEFGFPLGLKLENFGTDAASNSNLVMTDVTGDNIETITDDDKTGTYAIIDSGTPTGGVVSQIVLDESNSNLVTMLNEQPENFSINVEAVSNPNSPTGNSNFFNVNNGISIDAELEFPLHVTFDDLEFSPGPMEIDSEGIADNATELYLRLATRNTLPLNGTIKLDFVKNTGTEEAPVYVTVEYTNEDDVPNTPFKKTIKAITAAPVDVNGYSTYTLTNDVLKDNSGNIIAASVPMDEYDPSKLALGFSMEEIEALKEVTHLKITIKFDTDTTGDSNANAIKIQHTDQLKMDIAFKGDIKIKTENNVNNN